MKTTFDIVDIVFLILDQSELKSMITGNIYKDQKPVDSNVEDIVVGSLPVTIDMVQRATANVNIHVPDISVQTNGLTQKMPNHTRLSLLSSKAVEILKEHYSETYNLWVGNQAMLQESEASQHYVNLRIEFKNHQKN